MALVQKKTNRERTLFFTKALSWRSDHISQTPPSGLIMLCLAPRGFPWQYLEDILSGLKVHISYAGSQGQGSQPAAPELTGTTWWQRYGASGWTGKPHPSESS